MNIHSLLQIATGFLFLFLSEPVPGQDLQVTYKVRADNLYNTSRPDTLPNSVQELFKKAGENLELITYTLNIKDDQALFFRNDAAINEGKKNLRLTIALAGGDGKIFTSIPENLLLHERDTYGQDFLISSDYDVLDWQITGETKEIGNLSVHQAIASESYSRDGERKTWQIVAWFTPEISEQFGPLGYGNLPGLIVELSRAGKTYSISDYKRTALPPETVAKPNKGKKVSREELDKIGKRIWEQMQNR